MRSKSATLAAIAMLLTAMASPDSQANPPSIPDGATSSPQKTFFSSVTGLPSTVQIEGRTALPISVTVGPVPATGLRLMPTTLSEQSRFRPLAPLKLCESETGDCSTPPTIDPGKTKSLWLRFDDAHPSPGKYSGSIVIASNEKPQGDSTAMTIYATNPVALGLGVLAIVVGVAAGWFITVFAHLRFNRDQLLLPARLLADRTGHLLELVRRGNAQAPASDLERRLLALLDLLRPAALEQAGLIPSAVPAPWSNPAAQSGASQAFYQKVSDLLSDCMLIVTEGLQPIWSAMPADPAQPPTPDITRKAVAQLEALLAQVDCSAVLAVSSATVPGVAAVAQQVATVVTTWQQAFAQASAARMLTAGSRADEASSPHQISLEIRKISMATWLAVLMLSVVAGSYQLIYQNLGFGIGGDYFICFFWGLGLPIGAGQLLQMNGGSVASALQVQLPK